MSESVENVSVVEYKPFINGLSITLPAGITISTQLVQKQQNPVPKVVVFMNPRTIVKWTDGTETECVCTGEDEFDEMEGFMNCFFKKLYGSYTKALEAQDEKKKPLMTIIRHT